MKTRHFASWFILSITPYLFGQTAFDLNAKYPAVNAHEVRPGVLMTAKYALNGQVCELTLQRFYSPKQADGEITIGSKQEDELINELAPESERGPVTSKWLRNSFLAGGQSHIERDFVNALVVEDGTYTCSEGEDGKLNCGEGGTRVITIQWKNRTCADGKVAGIGNVGKGIVKAGEADKGNGGTGAGEETKAGGSPEGDGPSAPFGEIFAGSDNSVGHGAEMTDVIRGRDKARDAAGRSGPKAQQGQRSGETAGNSADALNRR